MKLAVLILSAAVGTAFGASESINGLDDLAGQSNEFWNTTGRVATVLDASSATLSNFQGAGFAATTSEGTVDARDYNVVTAILNWLNFRDPSGFILFLR